MQSLITGLAARPTRCPARPVGRAPPCPR